jgi:glutathione S-transferase/GST-like protein
MTVRLYIFQPLVTNSARVYQALLEKEVEFEPVVLGPNTMSHLSPEFLKINPAGQVPAMTHGDLALAEGMCMQEYIDEAFEGPPLRPSDLRERWRMRCWQRYAETDLGRALMMINWNRIMPRMRGSRTADEMKDFAKNVPDPDRRRAWLNASQQTTPPEQIEESHRRVRDGVARIEAALGERPWIAGQSFSLADIDVFHFFGFKSMWLPDWIAALINETDTPRTVDWVNRMEERPSTREIHARTVRPPPPPAEAA